MTRRCVHALLLGVAVAVGLIACERRAEVIRLVPLERVSVIDPSTVAGVPPRVVGSLAPGEIVYVTACNPRKSDIDVEVSANGAAAVAHGKYRLERRMGSSAEEHAIRSCMGLLGGGN